MRLIKTQSQEFIATACRSKEEIDQWEHMDNPITRFRRYLEKKGWWNEEEEQAWIAKVRVHIHVRQFASLL